ncbi:MAG TPA: TonB-dependent receptor [Rhodanobacteraceae bacterium]|nr:TonB-dependent receptor [Rhodanobacteraceae bacterium]
MNRKLLASAICASLFVAATAYAQDNPAPAQQAQDQSTAAQSNTTAQTDKKKEPKTLNTVTVTGSLIPQSQIETANPVITITAQEMQQKGFSNVYDALRAQPLSTGAVQDSTFSAGFTPGAETISLLGLPPDFTLFLLNGRPMADFPLLYNGSANFTDLSNIPMSMVDHIDILPGNQSSIYGSSAIAGVVNVVLKKKLQGYNLEYRAGGYSDGGGQQQRINFSGGYNNDKLSVLYSFQADDQHPMFGYNRDLTSSTLSNPNPSARNATPAVVAWFADSYRDANGKRHGFNHYYDPNDYGGCGSLNGLFGGTVTRQERPNRAGTKGQDPGYYCGSYTELGYSTLQNKKRDYSGYVNFTYQINNNAQLFGSLLYAYQKQRTYSGPNYNWWAPDGGNYIWNPATQQLEFYEKLFSPEEIGGPLVNADNQTAKMYNGDIGIRGSFGDSNWNYEGYLSRSDYKVADKQLRPLNGPVEDFFRSQFLGPQNGTYYGYAVYTPDFSKFLKPITPADYRGFSDYIRSDSHTYTQIANVQITNSSLFHLPGGDVGFAALLQAGNQYWNNPTDPRVIAGDFWGLTGTSGSGKRDNYAAAVEFLVPIFSKLTADVSARYDGYKNVDASSDSKPTYKIGLEYRPLDTLLLRANYATAFRAPDMANVFQGPSGYYSSTTDYYKCEKYDAGVPLPDCAWDSVQYKGFQEGNHKLKSITAKSWGYGVVWSPTNKFTVKADYYDISIKNEISPLSVDGLMRTEAQCRLGQLDINSPTCVDALERIARTAVNTDPRFSENIQSITVGPINVSNEHVKGIVASLDYRLDAGRFGDFTFGARYNDTLHHSYQQYPNDPSHDLLHEPEWSSEFKTIFTGSVTWDIGKWSTTVLGQRFGATPNYAAQVYGWGGGSGANAVAGTVAPWMVYNASVKYQVTPDISTQLIVNNVFDSMPPRDKTWVGWPYYNQFNYNPFGRIIWLDLNIHFGK